MKNVSVLTLTTFVISQIFAPLSWARTQEAGMAIESQGVAAPDAQNLTEDTQRYKELLAIWKDHVKTVTRERDAAYQEIEALRGGQGIRPAQEAAGPAYSSEEKEKADEAIADLRSQVQALQARLQASTPDEKLRLLQKELQETKGDKEIIMRDKEAALREIEELRSALTQMDSSSGSEEESQKIIDDLTTQVANLQADAARARSLDSEIVKIRAEKAAIQKSQNQQAAVSQETAQLKNEKAVFEKKYQLMEDNFRLQQARLKDFSKRKDEADRRIVELQAQIDTLSSAGQASQSAQADVSALRAQKEALLEENQHSRQTISQLRSELDSLRSGQKAIEARATQSAQSIQADLATVRTQNQSLLGENQNSRQTIAQLRSELDSLRSGQKALEVRASQNGTLTVQVGSLEEEIKSLQAQHQNATQALQSVRSEKASTEASLAALKNSSQSAQQNAARRVEALESEIQSLRSRNEQLEAVERELSDAQVNEGALRQERDKAFETVRELEARVSELSVESEKVQALQAELGKKQSSQDALQQTYEVVKNKYQAQEDRLIELAIRVKDVKQANEALVAENQSVRNAIASLEQNAKLQAAESAKREENLKNHMQALQAQTDKLRGVSEELQKTRAEKESVERSFAELKAAYDSRGEQLKKAMQDREFVSAELQKLRTDVQKLHSDIETLRGEKAAVQSANQNLQKQDEASRQKASLLSVRVSELDQASLAMKQTIQGLQRELQANRADFQALRQNVNSEFEAALASIEKRAS